MFVSATHAELSKKKRPPLSSTRFEEVVQYEKELSTHAAYLREMPRETFNDTAKGYLQELLSFKVFGQGHSSEDHDSVLDANTALLLKVSKETVRQMRIVTKMKIDEYGKHLEAAEIEEQGLIARSKNQKSRYERRLSKNADYKSPNPVIRWGKEAKRQKEQDLKETRDWQPKALRSERLASVYNANRDFYSEALVHWSNVERDVERINNAVNRFQWLKTQGEKDPLALDTAASLILSETRDLLKELNQRTDSLKKRTENSIAAKVHLQSQIENLRSKPRDMSEHRRLMSTRAKALRAKLSQRVKLAR